MKQLLWTALYQIIDILQALFKNRLMDMTASSDNSDDNDVSNA